MNENMAVYILFFVSAALLTLGAQRYYAKDQVTQKKINRRMSLLENASNRAEVLEVLRRERGLSSNLPSEQFQELQDFIVQSGINLHGTKFAISIIVLAFCVTTTTIIAIGFNIQNVLLSLCLTIGVVFAWVRRARKKRIAHFGEQLPDVLDVIVRSLKAGHPLPVALSLVGNEMPDPAGTEFGIASDEVRFGLDLSTAMLNLSKRVGDPDLLYLLTSISVQAQSGGNLAEVLARLSKLIRERFRLRRKVASLASEGRASAVILTVIPVLLAGFIYLVSPKFFLDVANEPIFRKAMVLAVVLLIVGNVTMRRMVNFKF